MRRAITTTLAPNYQADDVRLAVRLLGSPWRWRRGTAAGRLERQFERWLPVQQAVSFTSGRAALYAVLQALPLQSGDEVVLQAFTCIAVPAAVQWAKATPVYVDIEPGTYTMDASEVEKKITPRSRAVIVQHTFGYPADIDPIAAIARRHGLYLIEDCAHAMGVTYRGRQLGQFGDAAIFSFGRDKVISAVFGGMAAIGDEALAQRVRAIQRSAILPRNRWVAQQLLHPPLTTLAQRTLHWGLGKVILRVSRSCGILSLAVAPAERTGQPTGVAAGPLANALAQLALHQLAKLERYNRHRQKIAAYYRRELAGLPAIMLPPDATPERGNGYLLFTLRVPHPAKLLRAAQDAGLHLGEWYRTVIAPHDAVAESVGYRAGSCPRAEAAAATVVNLPTHIGITLPDAARLVEVVRRAAV